MGWDLIILTKFFMKKHEADVSIRKFICSEETITNYNNWFSDPEVLKFLHPNTPYTQDPDTKVSIEEWCKWMEEKQFAYNIYYNNKSVGHIEISAQNEIWYVGVVIGDKKNWNKGIAYKAGQEILQIARNNKINSITANININNIPSQKLFEKLGFVRESQIDNKFAYKIFID